MHPCLQGVSPSDTPSFPVCLALGRGGVSGRYQEHRAPSPASLMLSGVSRLPAVKLKGGGRNGRSKRQQQVDNPNLFYWGAVHFGDRPRPSLHYLFIGAAPRVLWLHDIWQFWGAGEGLDPQSFKCVICIRRNRPLPYS